MRKKVVLKLFISINICIFSYLNTLADPIALSDWQQPYAENAVFFSNYTSVLNCTKKTPYYVFYDLTLNDFSQNASDRKDKWPYNVPSNIRNICGNNYATSKDYTRSGFDRGHLAPASDFRSFQNKENETFSFANAAPQNKILNRTTWEQLEKYERKLAVEHNGITVITGVIQSNNNYIGNYVGVPDYFYKIIFWKENSETKNVAFIAPNTASTPKEIDIKELESLAGLNFGF